MDVREVLNPILLGWSIISVCLYVMAIYILLKNRKTEPFNARFFSLFVSLGFADIMTALYLFGYALFRYWGWIDFDPIFNHPNQTVAWFSRAWVFVFNAFHLNCQYLAVLWIAINRYLNLTHGSPVPDVLWTERIHKIALVSQWLLPLIFGGLPFLFNDYILDYIVMRPNTTGTYTYLSVWCADKDFDKAYFFIMSGVVWNSGAIFIGCLYAKSFLHIRKIRKEAHHLTGTMKSNIRLAIIGLTVFILMAIINLDYTANRFLEYGTLRELFVLLKYITKVVFSLINPWLLLICSKATRNKFRQTFCSPPTAVQPVQ